jgi:hypothetical protein
LFLIQILPHPTHALAPIFGGNTSMKYLLRVLFILALLCGVSSVARASAVNFHVQVLDPNVCISNPSVCVILNAADPISVSLNAATCQLAGVPNLPSGSDYGCAILFNLTLPPENITSLNVTFSGLGNLTFDCPTSPVGNVGSIFASSSCGSSGPGTDTFSFFDGSFPFFSEAVIYENGVSPDLFQDGTGNVNQPPFVPTPEPESLLLISTGVAMAGGYLTRQRRLLASKAKK